MQVLRATQTQYEAMDGYISGASELRFGKDADGHWITGAAVLNDPPFAALPLDELIVIEFNPVVMGDE